MKLINKTLIPLLLTLALASCGNEFNGDDTKSQFALEFNANIGETSTRLSGTTWGSNETIGVNVKSTSGGTSGTNVAYSNSSSNTSKFTSATPIYFNDTKDVTFSAYYPRTTSGGNVSLNTTDQSTTLDYLYAEWTCKYSSSTPSINFTHVMSKLSLTIKAGSGVSSFNGNISYSLPQMYTSGTFNTTSGAISYSSTSTISKSISASGTSTALSMILLPQTLSNGLPISLTYGGNTYTANISLTELKAAYNYAYTITISKNGLTISSASVTDWTSTTNPSVTASLNTIGSITDPEQVRRYDLAMSDGSFVSHDVTTLTDEQISSCIGVVFWTKYETDAASSLSDDAFLMADYPNCTHGLIVATKSAGNGVKWQNEFDDTPIADTKCDNYSNFGDLYLYCTNNYQTNIHTGNTTLLNKIVGYKNTKLLEDYNDEHATSETKVVPVECVREYAKNYPVPTGFSQWYVPSAKEVYLMTGYDTTIDFFTTPSSHPVSENIEKRLALITGSTPIYLDFIWTSFECGAYNAIIVGIYKYDEYDDTGFVGNDGVKGDQLVARAVCAF